MLRRTKFPSSASFATSSVQKLFTSSRYFSFPPHDGNSANLSQERRSTTPTSFESADDVRLEAISNFMTRKPFPRDADDEKITNDKNNNNNKDSDKYREEELVILVDATALLYRTAYNWAAVMAGKGALEADPTAFLQSRLPRILQFCHSVIPNGDGSEHQPCLLPPDVAVAAAELRFLTPIGGPWFSVAQLASSDAMLAKRKETSDQMEIEKKEERKTSKKALKNNNNNNDKNKKPNEELVSETEKSISQNNDAANNSESENDNSSEASASSSSSIRGRQILFAETASSPGFFKRRVIFCFDHGSRSYLRSQFISDYKGHRSRCGRLSSFVGYASALSRQLETCGLIQGTFPALEWAPVLHDHKQHLNGDDKFQAVTNRFMIRDDDKITSKTSNVENDNNDKNGYRCSLSSEAQEKFPDDIVMQSLYDGATRLGPQATPTAAEGDDILHTCVKYFSEVEKVPTVVITHDKDLLQLLEFPKTYFFHLKQNKFVSRSETCEMFGLSSPRNLQDYLSLVGDAVDNVPGLPGTGHHLALAILKKFGTIENLVQAAFDNLKLVGKEEKEVVEGEAGVDKTKSSSSTKKKIVKGGEPVPDLKLSGSSFTKTGKVRQISSTYLNNFFPLVREHAERLLQNKNKVIGLYDVPAVENFLKEHYGKCNSTDKQQQHNNDPVVVSKKISGPLIFPTIPSHFFTPGVFRRNMNLGNDDKKYLQKRKHSNLPNEGIFSAVRDYYIKSIGPCDSSNEKIHHCGDVFGSNSASSKKMRAFEKNKQEKNKNEKIQQEVEEHEEKQQQQQKEKSETTKKSDVVVVEKRPYKKRNPNVKAVRGVVAVKPKKMTVNKNGNKNQKSKKEIKKPNDKKEVEKRKKK